MCLKIDKKEDTPLINLEKGLIKIEGRSLPENVIVFYSPIIKWVRKYSENPAEFTSINIFLSYTNSSSLKSIIDILSLLDDAYVEGNKMELNWSYEQDDDSILEIGQDLKSSLKMPVNYIEKKIDKKKRKKVLVKNIKTGKIGEITLLYWESIKRNGHSRNYILLSD